MSLNPKSQSKGRFKLGISFSNNLDQVYYFWSNLSQDIRGVSAFRFRKLVISKPEWIGKIAWAAIYENGQRIQEFAPDQGWH